jgi:glycosyltransferase involved in cell wall biosynthesis
MHGSVNQDGLARLWATADVFVLPSFAEGIPVALMEAMSMEIPVISTYVAGIPELIESGRDGILVPPADPKLLADAIETVATDPPFRHALARAGRKKVIESYNLRHNVEQLAHILRSKLSIAH